jgi:hypothetical protein
VKLYVPATSGVPEITPVEAFSDRPGGNDPPLTDHEYGGTPPAALPATYAAGNWNRRRPRRRRSRRSRPYHRP